TQRFDKGRGRSGDGAGASRRRLHRQAGAEDILGWLCRLLPRSRRPPMGSCLESRLASGRVTTNAKAEDERIIIKPYVANPGAGLAGLTLREIAEPEPGPRQVLMRVRANS